MKRWAGGVVVICSVLLVTCSHHNGLTLPKGRIPKRHDVALPTPAQPVKSTLQFRPILGAGPGSCPLSAENPAPEQPATMPGGSRDTCYQVGPSGLTVTRATITAFQEGDNFYTVVKLGRADTPGLDAFARQNFGKQIAIVALGRVLSAPMLNSDSFNGEAQIYGMTRDQAGQLKAALAG